MLLRAFLFLAFLELIAAGCARTTSPLAQATSEDRIPTLKQQIAEQEEESAQAVADYAPATRTQIDDLHSPVVDLLRQLPGVVQVEVAVTVNEPTSRIIHIRDWHFIPRELFALDMKEVHGRDLADKEIDRLYQEFLLEVELVQIEQLAILRCLIRHHGLKRVHSEGFSPNELEAYREKIAVLKSMEEEQIPQIREQLAEVRKLIAESADEQKEKPQEIERQLLVMLEEHKRRVLEMGAAGRLLISGELENVLPLEDADAFENANPISSDGAVKLDPDKIEARHNAQVKAVLKQGTVAVIVLGGAHDLTESVRRSAEDCEYLRVTTKRYSEVRE